MAASAEPRRAPVGDDLAQNPANHRPLTPLLWLERTAAIHPERLGVVHGERRFTWSETARRCRRLASALARRGIGRGDVVAIMAPNIPAMFEAHYGVPMCGAVLNALNYRLDPPAIAFILRHGGARVLFTDREYAAIVEPALALIPAHERPLVIDIDDADAPPGKLLGMLTYEAFLLEGDPLAEWSGPPDEWDAITLSYTSGTTGDPKGVVAHHRGMYLNALGNVVAWGMTPHPIYLWTLPMFHAAGWCFHYTATVLGGTHVCLRRVDAAAIFAAIAAEGVTHMCGAPIVVNMMVHAPEAAWASIGDRRVKIMTAGAAPPAAVIEAIERRGCAVTHVYGLTETYGPVTVCEWNDGWDALPAAERARIKARQGVAYPVLDDVLVADPTTLVPTPRDGVTMGEILMRGNVVMKGYHKNPSANDAAFSGGWFHTGDLGVCHPDGYVEIKDRAKDIVISGGENISTIEVEEVLYRHPAVLEAAVVARPDEKWGETPCAFVALKDGVHAEVSEVIAFCRANMAHFKAPRTVVFGPLPKTSTGKMQKFVLRERARQL